MGGSINPRGYTQRSARGIPQHVTAAAGDNAEAARRSLVVLALAAESLLGFLAPSLADLLLEDLDAQGDAFVADVDAGAGDQLAQLRAGLPQNEQPVARSVPVAFARASVTVSVAVAAVS